VPLEANQPYAETLSKYPDGGAFANVVEFESSVKSEPRTATADELFEQGVQFEPLGTAPFQDVQLDP
jgi:hypothetical protein